MKKQTKLKRIYSLDDLENFYSNKYKRSTHFSSKETGYQLAVQVPAYFEKDDEIEDDTLLYCKVRFFHIGLNRNHSNVTKEAAEKASKTMAYKPLLANFCEIEVDGETVKDFTSHDAILNEDGTIQYLEHQIGCITKDDIWFEDYEGKTYVCGYVAIPREYTDAVDIIERKNGTKVSVELLINECQYQAKLKQLDLTDVIVSGVTCLGTNPNTGEEVQEGMINSRLDIKDFSQLNNSIIPDNKGNENTQLIEMLNELNSTIANLSSKFNINNSCEQENFKEDFKEGGKDTEMTKFEQLLKQYSKMEEDITFEVEGLTDEELEKKFAEAFETENSDADPTSENEEETKEETETETVEQTENEEVEEVELPKENESEETETEETEEVIETAEEETEQETETETEETTVTEDEACKKKKYVKEFELSHDDIRWGIYNLLAPYEERDNEYYYIEKVYDDYFIYAASCAGKYFGQKYSKNGDAIAFEGERYELFVEFLTESEKVELETMRSNYASISEKLSNYELAEELADKKTVFSDEAYSNYLDTEEFKNIMNEDVLKKFTKEELVEKADAALGKLIKANKNFAFNGKSQEKPKTTMFHFAPQENKNNDFLQSLLKK